ncbi:hypothetical protein K438DRAFT_1964095 [Mycena galopus ATCC 62051]|nr:hypothetical protein K438DRAFT_1964095 [Mycena galopus ATCC 62051]
MPENFRERADLTKIIKSILDSYPLGNGILRELLQNSDDASATQQTFILDLRTHPSNSVVDPDLIECQGPALLAVNDTLFSDSDWKAISTLHSSSKTADETKIGKFGIGLTDNPHFLSGRKLVIFDPHERFSAGQEGGVRIDVLTEGHLYPDQLAAFDKSLGPDAAGLFPGTVVRLPLRTVAQAAKSTIKPTTVDLVLIKTMFDDFVEKELSVVMLFLKHIRYICLKVISAEGQEHFIGSAEIPDVSIAEKRAFSRNVDTRQETFKCAVDVTVRNAKPVRQVWRILHAVRSRAETTRIMNEQLGYDVASKLMNDKLFSHVALAFPVQPSVPNFNGRLFTLLPLPIHTNFPLHLHAILALTQDRQSLRNIEETGTGLEARERLLVAWNRSIFNQFLPATWAALLRALVDEHEVKDIWSAWPAMDVTSGSGYWSQILPDLMKRVLDLDLPVFPAFPDAEIHVSLSSSFVASENDDVALLRALANAGLAIVKLPQHLLRFVSPSLFLHPSASSRISTLAATPEEDKNHILRYLVVAPGDVTHVIGLPLVPLIDGSRVSLSGSFQYVLVTTSEGEIFGDSDCNGHLIALSNMPVDAAAVFCAANLANVARLNAMHVRNYLNIVFGGLDPAEDEVAGDHVSSKVGWLTRFWKWMSESTWDDKHGLLLLVNPFHLLPTTQGTLRKMESRTLLPVLGPKGNSIMTAWGTLGLGFLHPSVVPYASAFPNATVTANDIPFLISSISAENISNLDSKSAELIQEHLIQALASRGTPPQLDNQSRQKLLRLPIFPTRVPIPDPKGGKKLSQRKLGTASGIVIYMRVDDSCPVPIVREHTFFDVVSRSGILGTVVNPTGMKRALDELGVLEMAVDKLVAQPGPILDALLHRIIHRLSDLSEPAKKKLHDVPFVPVLGRADRIPPSQVIDPRSKLASLYGGEPGKLPRGRWGNDYLPLLASHGFYKRELTVETILERITYLATTWPADEHSRIFFKARKFVELLDEVWPTIPPTVAIANSLTKTWMPVHEDRALAAPTASRDKGEKTYLLFDLVYSTVSSRVYNPGLRSSLGWDSIPTPVLQDQLQRALIHIRHRPNRLHALITELSQRPLSDAEIDSLKLTVSSRPWIPIRDDPPEIVETKHALLRLESRLGGRFKAIPRSLFKARDFLRKMGCTESPSLENLLAELEVLVERPDRSGQILKELMELLQEIPPVLPGCSQEDYERIFVPGQDGDLHPISQVYFVDCSSDFLPETGFAAHPAVSESLARELRVQFLSSLELGADGDDEDDLQMGEDFTKRVEGVLKEHDIFHALNEFLANAIDAKARTFSVLLDERTFACSKVLAPGLTDLQRRPSLILYNDAMFTETDFRGLRQVGQGGKRSNPDSIGRYGLGALSLFHFTDVVQIVSNQHFLILDPSGTHLPPLEGRPRTSLLRRISDVLRRYPDQLSAFESIQGFSKDHSSYSGTLFRLPLRDGPGVLSSTTLSLSDCENLLNGPYFELGKDSMYFTCLEKVSAARQPPMGPLIPLWSVDVERPVEKRFNRELVSVRTSSRDSPASSQLWLVTKSITPISSVPSAHKSVLEGMGLQESKIGLVVRMALLLEHSTAQRTQGVQQPVRNHLFSTLRLPVETSLSAHISAPWAISSSRRYIIFEPPDSTGRRVDQAEFNSWILDTLVPPLYISTIHEAATANLNNLRGPRNPFPWWPVNDANNNDSISRAIVRAFYDSVPQSSVPICFTSTANLIAPVDAVFPRAALVDHTPFSVQQVLRLLHTPNFVELPHSIERLISKASTAGQLRFVDPSFTRSVLQSRSIKLAELFTAKRILDIVTMIDDVLGFLLKGAAPVSDLLLLVTADGTLTHGSSQCPIKYAVVKGARVPEIFPRSHFLHENMNEETQALLINTADMNVRRFDASGVLALVKQYIQPDARCTHPLDTQRWIFRFWEIYRDLPGPPTPASLDSLPLIPTANGEYISLEYCRRDDVVTEPRRPALVSAMQEMAIVFCRIPGPLQASFNKPFNLKSFLKAIRFKAHPFDNLSPEEAREVGHWIRSDIHTCTDADSRTILKGLPIWEARQNGRTVLIDAHRLEMLPRYGLDAEIFDGYARSDIAIAKFNHDLGTVLSWPPKIAAMTSERLAELLVFPDILDFSDVDRYSTLLTGFLNIGGTGMIPVPDGNRRLRQVDSLYDHSVELFAVALQSLERSLFLHPDFRHMHPELRAKGLHFEVDWAAFLLCAQTVDGDLTTRYLPESEIVPRAEVVYHFYHSSLPRLVMQNTDKWRQLDGLRFIPREESRSPSSSFPADSYCEHLPQIVCPSQILLQKHEKIAWSQRALCQEEPTGVLSVLNKSMGIPTVAEVVAHLVILTQTVAVEHPGNRTLLQQICATYEWLNENRAEARGHLLCTPVALFLNVDDPSSETWEWRKAAQLLFDIEYDFPETDTFRARRFLQDYRPLLLAAGAEIEHAVDYRPKTRAQDGNTLQVSFDAMRKAGQLTDTVLMPTTGEVVDEGTLRAHSAFLAAAIPHVRYGLSDWAEGRSGTYSFPGSYFGACAVLDFIYTGKIERTAAETEDGHMILLRDLLELLRGADEWGMLELKDEIGRLIRDKKLLSRDTYQMIREEAKEYQAKSLEEYCEEWGRKNPRSVPSQMEYA